jgi:hypothetical protein
MEYTCSGFKSFYEPFKGSELPKIRIFCSNCGKPRRIDDDDLAEVLSKSDFCRCAEDQLSWALSRISELEELLEETKDRMRCIVEGEAAEWNL